MKAQPSRSTLARFGVLAAAFSAGALWLSCSSETVDSPAAPEPLVSLSPSGGPPDLARAIALQERHTPFLMAIPGVVGTAVGLDPTGKPVIRVFTSRPDVTGLPDRVEEVEVGVEVTGLFVAGSNPTTKQRPAPLGFSVGHPDITAGTIGARVKNGAGTLYILSNNHVLANSNDAQIGDPTLQPGPFDGGTASDQVGTLSDFEPINFSGGNNTMDAAIAATTAANVGFATPTDDGYGAPSASVSEATLGLGVKKYGRTTELTQGDITEINVTVTVCYEVRFIFCTKSARFVNQLGIEGGSFSDGGDSGSLIVTQSGNNPVGLLFAGSDTRTLANPIGPVLDQFNVTIDDGSGGGGGNNPPTASFSFDCTGLSCSFDGSGSSDSDGSIQSYTWDFGDGNTGTGATTSHTYAASGTYTVTLTVTDDDNATDSQQQSVPVSDGTDTTMHVGDLDGSSTSQGNRWTASVTILVHDGGHDAVPSATVTGSFGGAGGTRSCTTDSAGACSVSRDRISNRRANILFTVTEVTHATRSYASGDNHDPDGDSDGTSITVSGP